MCNGVCVRYKAKKPISGGRYANGQRMCNLCEIFIYFDGLNCPCCHYRLRCKPRNIKYKTKLREFQESGLTTTYGIISELKNKELAICTK